jgi:predicted AAA+ superfamily ATPase
MEGEEELKIPANSAAVKSLAAVRLSAKPWVLIIIENCNGTFQNSVMKLIPANFIDLESPSDRNRLKNPELYLGGLSGLVIIDEIQKLPGLFPVLRVLADQAENNGRFLILGSASPDLIRSSSETLAGRVEFIDLQGFNLGETGDGSLIPLWQRGGFPRSFWLKMIRTAKPGEKVLSEPFWNGTSLSWGSASRLPLCGGSGRCWPIAMGRFLTAQGWDSRWG